MSLFIPTYFSPISQYKVLVNAENIVFEVEDNFQKQTYRNRCYIYAANGKQLLNIPVKHPNSEGRKKTKDCLVENNSHWQSQHLKSLEAAYRNSPFYEYYIDDLLPIFTKNYNFLVDVNIDSFTLIMEALQLSGKFSKTTDYQTETENDFRAFANAKQPQTLQQAPYIQMFDDKYGFIPDLSILDLLFMEGPNAITYLEKKRVNLV